MKQETVIWRQVIAFLLLAVFFTIQSGKVLHSHAAAVTTQVSFDGTTVEQTGDCAICDYHLAKDAEQPYVAADLIRPAFIVTAYNNYPERPATSIGLHFSDRGPPALA